MPSPVVAHDHGWRRRWCGICSRTMAAATTTRPGPWSLLTALGPWGVARLLLLLLLALVLLLPALQLLLLLLLLLLLELLLLLLLPTPQGFFALALLLLLLLLPLVLELLLLQEQLMLVRTLSFHTLLLLLLLLALELLSLKEGPFLVLLRKLGLATALVHTTTRETTTTWWAPHARGRCVAAAATFWGRPQPVPSLEWWRQRGLQRRGRRQADARPPTRRGHRVAATTAATHSSCSCACHR